MKVISVSDFANTSNREHHQLANQTGHVEGEAQGRDALLNHLTNLANTEL